jgi:hypothetical protein
MKTKICSNFFVVICIALVAMSLSLVSCNVTPGSISVEKQAILCKQVQNKSYLALIEGMQPLSGERMKVLGEKLSHVLNVSVCATSGSHDVHMNIIREAYKHHQKIYIAGFSAGEKQAIELATNCEKEGIPIEKLFLLDGVEKAKIPRTVKSAVDIVGTSTWMFRRGVRYLKSDLENKNTNIGYYEVEGDHLGVPENSYPILLSKFP